ncbi:MAG TPA: MFS transporter [Candidatus Methylacidiphilales bacterium]|jgi:MFS family permease|nr:MFS transporter [Candidatus Methylacidiphilales bacterium]
MHAIRETAKWIETHVPQRLDRLPWSRWHVFVVVALGITWMLDGLEVTLAGALGPLLTKHETLGLTPAGVGLSGTAYLVGAVIGALGFGYLTDLWGRKRLFYLTLSVYLLATLASAFSWNLASYVFFRACTGAGIGGEYAAINSAIDELIPARVRGRVGLAINAAFWLGALVGSGATLVLLDPALMPVNLGWRLAFGIGAGLGLFILCLRRWVPESPRWLMLHGHEDNAERVVGEIEKDVRAAGHEIPRCEEPPLRLRSRAATPLREIWDTIVRKYRTRSLLGFVLMAAQAFFYNAIFFSLALVLAQFYHVPAERVGLYMIPFAIGNALGPMVLGVLFDTLGRKPMITATYALSGALLIASGWLFVRGELTAVTQVAAWTAVFFIASSAASSAYVTVSEIFPLEVRALAIAIFYASGTAIGGAAGPILFGYLAGTGSRADLFFGYVLAGLAMMGAACFEAFAGVKAERQSLESIAPPLAQESV